MSGTPKHTNASVEAERRRQAQEDRERRARAEAAVRAEEERRQMIERRDRLRDTATRQADNATSRVIAARTGSGRRFVIDRAADELIAQANRLAAEARAANTEAEAQAVARQANELANRAEQLVTRAAAGQRAAEQLAQEVATAAEELTRATASPAGRYLPGGSAANWQTQLNRIGTTAAGAADLEVIRVAATELSGVRGTIRQADAEATATLAECEEGERELTRLTAEIDAFARGELRTHTEAGRVEQLTARAGQLMGELRRAPDRAAVAAVRRETAALRDELSTTTEAATAIRRTAHLAAEAQALARLRGEVAALDPARCQKFHPTGWTELQARFATADGHLGRGELEASRPAIAAARQAFDLHRAHVAREFQTWQRRRAEAAAELASGRTRLDGITSDPERQKWVAGPAHDLTKQADEVERLITQERFEAAREQAAALAREAERVAALADQLHAEADRLAELRARTAAAQPVPDRVFDTEGAREIARLLDAACSALKQNRLDTARQHATAARDRLARHEQTARETATKWQKDHDDATGVLAAARARLAALRADAVVGRWQAAGIAELERLLDQAQAELGQLRGDPERDRMRFDNIARAADRLPPAIQRLVTEANRLQVQADLQQQIADGVTRAMHELGFAVAPALENPADPRSAIVLQASRDNGDLINVAVEHEGRIEYDVGGRLEKREEVGAIGRPVKRCDEAEEQILRMHEILRSLGINTDGLKWDDQPPPDDHGAAMANPVLAGLRQTQPRVKRAGG